MTKTILLSLTVFFALAASADEITDNVLERAAIYRGMLPKSVDLARLPMAAEEKAQLMDGLDLAGKTIEILVAEVERLKFELEVLAMDREKLRIAASNGQAAVATPYASEEQIAAARAEIARLEAQTARLQLTLNPPKKDPFADSAGGVKKSKADLERERQSAERDLAEVKSRLTYLTERLAAELAKRAAAGLE